MTRFDTRFFQLGYVCVDLDRAIASFSPAQGAPFLVLDVAALGGDADNPIRRRRPGTVRQCSKGNADSDRLTPIPSGNKGNPQCL